MEGWRDLRGAPLVLRGITTLLLLALAACAKHDVPPDYFRLPSFSLVSHEGKPYGSAELAGHAWVGGFFFTRCPTVCPVLLQREASVVSRTADIPDLRFVTISIDPEHDTPEVMTKAAAERGLELDRWTLLTGDTERVKELVGEGFHEYLHAGPDVTPAEVVHSVRFFLVDQQGRVRGLYDATMDEELDRLVEDARHVVAHPEETPPEVGEAEH